MVINSRSERLECTGDSVKRHCQSELTYGVSASKPNFELWRSGRPATAQACPGPTHPKSRILQCLNTVKATLFQTQFSFLSLPSYAARIICFTRDICSLWKPSTYVKCGGDNRYVEITKFESGKLCVKLVTFKTICF